MNIKVWYKSRRVRLFVIIALVCVAFYEHIGFKNNLGKEQLDVTKRYIDKKLEEALKRDKGSGCDMPKIDPFSPEIMKFDKNYPPIVCPGKDWVKCNLSVCRVVDEILENNKDVECRYSDIIHESDQKYTLEAKVTVKGADPYILRRSDHARVTCQVQKNSNPYLKNRWAGHVIGFRESPAPKAPIGREKSYNVLILGFDSTSKSGFIRRMPKSYKVLKEELNANILNGYNIVGDGTPASLFPILTGHTELELPEARRSITGSGHMDDMPFIFYKLKEDGYRTAYFEDSPHIGTFQYRFNGFLRQPADHYLRSFYLDVVAQKTWWPWSRQYFCVGDTPQYKLMLDITDQFFQQDGKKYCFTFIADITHDDFNRITAADDEFVAFLRKFKADGRLKDTLLLVMGDHGPRYANVRGTYQGRLEERLPLMAVILPDDLKANRPEAQKALKENEDVLTTPHDIHATVLDVIGLKHLANQHKVKGADLNRALTLLEPIPKSRSCSEAGIESHWCACLRWKPVSIEDPIYQRAAKALVRTINSITDEERDKCVIRTLKSIEYVLREQVNHEVLTFVEARDADGYIGQFKEKSLQKYSDNYQVKITVNPNNGVYEALVSHLIEIDELTVNEREISRINAYGDEPGCLKDMKPHLNMFCLCADKVKKDLKLN